MYKLKSLVVVLAILAAVFAGVPVVWAGTLDALLAEPGTRGVIHLEGIDEGAKRLAASFALKSMENDGLISHSLRDWLMSTPLSSISLALDSRGGHGAVAFSPESERARKLLAVLERGEIPEGNLLADLLGVTMTEDLEEDLVLIIRRVHDDEKLYEIDIKSFGVVYDNLGDFFAYGYVVKYGDDFILLVGADPEYIEKAREALENPGKRLAVKRSGKGGSFIQLMDNSDGVLFEEIGDCLDIYDMPVPKVPLFMELSADFLSEKMVFSLKHNLFSVLFGDAEKPKSSFSMADDGLKLGGGDPFFAGLGGFALDPDQVLRGIMVLMDAEDSDEEEAKGELKSMGIDLDRIVGAFRSAGMVLGGRGLVGEASAPGAYGFVSGVPGGMKALIPLVKMAVGTLPVFEESSREGWDFFYKPSEELYEELPLPLFIGMKDGVLAFGSIDERALDTAPKFEWGNPPMAEFIGRGRFDMRTFSHLLAKTLSPRSLSDLKQNDLDLEEELDLDEDDVLAAGTALKILQEVGAIEFTGGWDELVVTVETIDADHELLNELSGTMKRLAAE